ncbi:MAG: hypothetical protein KGI54_17275 [Pseudomonadota bacterium]|nr:hypothetical protein [Pseudomonadota bacterium]
MKTVCCNCTCEFDILTGHYNRAKKLGMNVYCGRTCAGIAHRKDISERQRKADKAAYNKARREREHDRINAQKRERYHATKEYRADILRAHRKKRASKHAEYCRRYEYREYKKDYDRKRLAKKNYGEFAEAALICRKVEEILDQQATKYDRRLVNGTLNKAQSRRRAL